VQKNEVTEPLRQRYIGVIWRVVSGNASVLRRQETG